MPSFDLIGSIAILKFRDKTQKEKKKIAEALLQKQKNIKTVLEKKEKIKGRLRTLKTKYLAGIKTKETIHKENGCSFLLNVEKCYFSPRLSNERLEVAKKIKKKDAVLVMFSGIGVYPIVISKLAQPKRIDAIELGRDCHKYALENAKRNKVQVNFFQGDIKKVVPKLIKEKRLIKYDKIIMPRPQLKETFLKEALLVAKRGTEIVYYGFCQEDELAKIIHELETDAKKAKKKIKILDVKKAGDIAPYKYRWRIELKVL